MADLRPHCLAGTFITEWTDGAKLCEAFLAGDSRSYQTVADQLVQIAQFFHFDGWLINIENSLSVSLPLCWCLPSPSPFTQPAPGKSQLCPLGDLVARRVFPAVSGTCWATLCFAAASA